MPVTQTDTKMGVRYSEYESYSFSDFKDSFEYCASMDNTYILPHSEVLLVDCLIKLSSCVVREAEVAVSGRDESGARHSERRVFGGLTFVRRACTCPTARASRMTVALPEQASLELAMER